MTLMGWWNGGVRASGQHASVAPWEGRRACLAVWLLLAVAAKAQDDCQLRLRRSTLGPP